MATAMQFLVNYVDAAVTYQTTSADYILVDKDYDYFIWTTGDSTVKDLMLAPPTSDDLNTASTAITSVATTIPLCLLYDHSHDVGGAYYTHKVIGMSENKRYVFCFSFNGATATEPRLEAWDTSAHLTANNYTLGAGTAANSMVKAVCTTYALPGASWAGTAIAGGTYLNLNGGNGSLASLASGVVSQELYANIKIVIPASFTHPAAESVSICVRYSYL